MDYHPLFVARVIANGIEESLGNLQDDFFHSNGTNTEAINQCRLGLNFYRAIIPRGMHDSFTGLLKLQGYLHRAEHYSDH